MSSAPVDAEFARLEPFGDAVRATRIDGVPVVHAEQPGIMRASLMFRVGGCDEPLHLRGITHLIEHLALHRFDALAHHKNGHVYGTSTEFVVAGSEAQVVDYLNGVCAALRELPLHRLEVEKTVLRTEGQARSNPAEEALLHARFGAGGPSRLSFDEYALHWVDAEQVSAWAREWFVAENAVLWVSRDELPAGLDLRLPSGRRAPRATVAPLDRPRPLSVHGPARILFADALVPRSTAASLGTELLRVVLFRELRLEGGLSYTAHASYEPLDADTARILLVADATEEQQGAVVGAAIDVVAALRAGRIDERDVESARSALREMIGQWSEPGVIAQVALGVLLFGDKPITMSDLLAEIESVTVDQLRDVIGAFWDDSVWSSPIGSLDWVGAVDADYSSPAVSGQWFEYVGSRDRLVIGDHGVSWVSPYRTLTVRADDCQVVVAAADGGRMLVGSDAVTLTIEPTLLRGFGDVQLAELDAVIPASVRVPFPARAADTIPVPPVVEPSPRPREIGLWAALVGVFVGAIALIPVAVMVPAGSLFLGLAFGASVLIMQRISVRRIEHRQLDVLTASGSPPESGSESISFTVTPTQSLDEAVSARRSARRRPREATGAARAAKPVVVVDKHVVSLWQGQSGSFFSIPTAEITAVSAGELPVVTRRGRRKKAMCIVLTLQRDEVQRVVHLVPYAGLMSRFKLADVEGLAETVRQIVGATSAAVKNAEPLSSR